MSGPVNASIGGFQNPEGDYRVAQGPIDKISAEREGQNSISISADWGGHKLSLVVNLRGLDDATIDGYLSNTDTLINIATRVMQIDVSLRTEFGGLDYGGLEHQATIKVSGVFGADGHKVVPMPVRKGFESEEAFISRAMQENNLDPSRDESAPPENTPVYKFYQAAFASTLAFDRLLQSLHGTDNLVIEIDRGGKNASGGAKMNFQKLNSNEDTDTQEDPLSNDSFENEQDKISLIKKNKKAQKNDREVEQRQDEFKKRKKSQEEQLDLLQEMENSQENSVDSFEDNAIVVEEEEDGS